MNPNNFLTIGKILNGTKSIIDTFDKILPLYNEMKPMISKLQSLKKKLQNVDLSKFKLSTNTKDISSEIKKKEITFPSSNPQFFI